MAGLSLAQRAKRALVTLLLALAQAYGVEVAVSRESADADIQRAFRKVARRVHPDKGGSAQDTQRLNAARDAWSAAAAQGPGRGRPRAAAVPAAVAEPGSGLRVRCEAVLLTYQSWSPDVALPAWERFGVFVHANLRSWSVKHWTATMESKRLRLTPPAPHASVPQDTGLSDLPLHLRKHAAQRQLP